MAKNIFAQSKEPVNQPKRNTFDLKFQNNLTMEFGKLYPVFCKEVVPGDSLRINPTFGLRFMPMFFPVQTRMQANLHFFYVRNRNLWKDWQDFIGRTKQNLVVPFLSKANIKKLVKTGALGDYLNLPTTVAGTYGDNMDLMFATLMYPSLYLDTQQYAYYQIPSGAAITNSHSLSWKTNLKPQSADFPFVTNYRLGFPIMGLSDGLSGSMRFKWNKFPSGNPGEFVFSFIRKEGNDDNLLNYMDNYKTVASITLPFSNLAMVDKGDGWYEFDFSKAVSSTGFFLYNGTDNTLVADSDRNVSSMFAKINTLMSGYEYGIIVSSMNGIGTYVEANSYFNTGTATSDQIEDGSFQGVTDVKIGLSHVGARDVSELGDSNNYYLDDNVRISALPFRAYESIYNAFYRNQQNDPFKIDGVPEYNKFITSNEGGEDNSDYDIRLRNWEMDYLTSCVPSPQQGDAPLVGVSSSGQFTFDNGDDTTTTFTPTVGPDGDTLTGIDSYSNSGDATEPGPGALARMKDIILHGISISDFRNVNALQRWLEVNMRRGLRYKDQIMSHFGVEAKYNELDMPEFIGGMSEPVMINQINQTVQAGNSGKFEDQLGSFAGQASILASSNHSIEQYCDEHGFIIGILSISPVPNYSQLLPKMFLKHDTLDYYFPEFGHIGLQPITYNEVCPLQTYVDPDSSVDDVFGYQRAWYDYLGSVDEVHGLMRTNLRNFLINRQFDLKPVLNHDFLTIDPKQVNDVFMVTDLTDKIVGQVYFEVSAKRPIPRFGIPRLEA